MNGENLAIDIHYNKLLEWLISRRHCQQQWQSTAVKIREAINNAIQDMPPVTEITHLLQGSYLNYFHCKRIVELLDTTDGSKNIFGQYSSQRMKDWLEIMKLYEADGVYLAEAAQLLMRNVNYELPALKKHISKCQQTQQECSRKEGDYTSNATELQEKYRQQCQQMGIEGQKIKRELMAMVDDLPVICASIVRGLSNLETACEYYAAFITFTTQQPDLGSCSLPLLRFVMAHGNVTVYEYRRGRVPSRVEKLQLDYGAEDEDAEAGTEANIDWGAEIEFDVENNQGGDDIDWGAGDVEIQVVDDSSRETEEEAVARGDEALAILDHTESRNTFTDDLMELEVFLSQRLMEMRSDTSVLSSAQFNNAPAAVQVDIEAVAAMLAAVSSVLTQLTSKRMKELFLIRSSPRYVHRLAEALHKILQDSERASSLARLMVTRRQEALEEQRKAEPKLDLFRNKTQELKRQIEGEISKKYKNRQVNIMGEVNTV